MSSEDIDAEIRNVDYLILSSTLDFSTDYVAYEFQQRGVSYFRVNRNQFDKYKIKYDVDSHRLIIEGADNNIGVGKISIDNSLKSIYFRCPVFIRSNKPYNLERQLYRSQWSSFIRNLTVFDKARWMNHPMNTYQAENKIYQLEMAKKIGLEIPKTIVANYASFINNDKKYVVKALDTPLFYEDGKEMFTYSTAVSGEKLLSSELKAAPVFIQEYIENKIDLRVTVIGNEIYPVKITSHGHGIDGDWRRTKKEDLEYIPVEIPDEVKKKLIKLMKILKLSFGGIDLTLSEGKYTFIEINPTGEWGWLVNTAGMDIHKRIVDWLI